MKSNNRFFGNLIMTVIILSIALPKVHDLFEPIKQYIPIGFMILILIEINSRIKYRTGKYPNIVRIPTNNDDYSRILPFIIGTIVSIGGISAIIISDSNIVLWTLSLLTGILLLILGFLFVPTGIISVKNEKLSFINGSKNSTIKIEQIKSIGFNAHQIIVTDKNHQEHIINHMNLIESDYEIITEFLNKRLLNKIPINVCQQRV